MLTVQDLSEVIRYFGLSLLIYVCNTDEAKIQAVAAGEDVLSGIKGQVLGEAVAILKQIKFQAASEGVPAALLISNISHSLEGDKRHIFNIWREHSGGVPPELATEDPVLSPLALIAADAYPILLLLPHLSENGQSISMLTIPSTFKHPSEQAFETAVLNDPDLSKLFPNRGENAIETNGYVFASTGSGGSLQLVVLANLFIGAAYSLTRMRGQTGIVEFHDSLCQVLEFVRQAARGDTIKVPAFVGFSNISMERSDPTELPWGKLRSYDSIGSELIPGSARPPVLGGENVSLGFVLESTYDYQLEIWV